MRLGHSRSPSRHHESATQAVCKVYCLVSNSIVRSHHTFHGDLQLALAPVFLRSFSLVLIDDLETRIPGLDDMIHCIGRIRVVSDDFGIQNGRRSAVTRGVLAGRKERQH